MILRIQNNLLRRVVLVLAAPPLILAMLLAGVVDILEMTWAEAAYTLPKAWRGGR